MKNMADQEFQKKVRERLADYEEEPNDGLWGGIHSGMSTRKSVVWQKRYISAAIFLLIAIISAYFYFGDRASMDQKAQLEAQQGSGVTTDGTRENDSDREGFDENIDIQLQSEEASNLEKNELSPVTLKNTDKINTGVTGVDEAMDSAIVWGLGREIKPRLWPQLPIDPADISLIHKIEYVKINAKAENGKSNEEHQKNKKNNKFKFYLLGMPVLTYNRIEANPLDDIFISGIEKIPALSKKRLGVRLEMGITYEINEYFSIYSGLFYFERKQQTNYTVRTISSITGEIQNDNFTKLIPEYEEKVRTYTSDLRNAGLQIGLLYRLSSENFLQTIGTGMEYHKVLAGTVSMESPSYYVFYNFFYRIEYPKQSMFKALVQPTFNYSLGINDDLNTPLYIKPYGIGLNIGVTYSIK